MAKIVEAGEGKKSKMREVREKGGVGKRNEVRKGGQQMARFKDRVKGEEMMGEAGRSGGRDGE